MASRITLRLSGITHVSGMINALQTIQRFLKDEYDPYVYMPWAGYAGVVLELVENSDGSKEVEFRQEEDAKYEYVPGGGA